MPMLKSLLAVMLIVSSTPASPQQVTTVDQFDLKNIGFSSDCGPNRTFLELLTLMAGSGDANPAIYEKVSGNIERYLTLDEPVAWNGLDLKAVHTYFGIERGPANYRLEFRNSAEQVREVWNKLGWRLPPVGESRDIKELEGYASIAAEAYGLDDQFGMVTCYRD